jgi:hypothetical protein
VLIPERSFGQGFFQSSLKAEQVNYYVPLGHHIVYVLAESLLPPHPKLQNNCTCNHARRAQMSARLLPLV